MRTAVPNGAGVPSTEGVAFSLGSVLGGDDSASMTLVGSTVAVETTASPTDVSGRGVGVVSAESEGTIWPQPTTLTIISQPIESQIHLNFMSTPVHNYTM